MTLCQVKVKCKFWACVVQYMFFGHISVREVELEYETKILSDGPNWRHIENRKNTENPLEIVEKVAFLTFKMAKVSHF